MPETKTLTLQEQIERPEIVGKFAKCLNNNPLKAQSFLRSVITVTQNNPMLKKCDPMSVLSSAMIAASLGLEINQNLGYAAIIPYGDKAQFQIMTNGLIQLFFRSGQAKKLNPFIVYTDEYNGFDKIAGELKPLKEHNFNCKEIFGYGCYIELVNGFNKTEFWTKEKVEQHAQKYSQAYRNHRDCPWLSAYDQMALKTVMKYVLVHYAPKTVDMQLALDADQATVKVKDDDTFDFDYSDNVSEVQYSEDEMKTRLDLLNILNQHGFDEDILCSYFKVENVSFIPTDKLAEKVNEITNSSTN